MSIFPVGLSRMLWLRQNFFCRWILYLWASLFSIRFFLCSINHHFPIYQHTVHDHIYELLLDFEPYYEVDVFLGQMTMFVVYTTYLTLEGSNILLWEQIVYQLVQQNWAQFVNANLSFEPTFQIPALIRRPRKTFTEWKEIFQKLRNFNSIRFRSSIKHFPYLDKRIRAGVLFNLVCLYFTFKILFRITSKPAQFIKFSFVN